MKTYKQWTETTNISIDGPPLNPKSIYGAESQIKELARNIRTTFGLDPRFNKQNITKACDLLDQAASMLDDGSMNGDQRQMPHRFFPDQGIR